jgi:hypothetical protein
MAHMVKKTWISAATGALCLVAWGIASQSADAAKTYQFTGKVTALSPDTISLKQGERTLEFNRGGLGDVKMGDDVTIWYTLDAQKAKSTRAPRQEPGQAAPKKSREKKQIIIDDRAFYDARNDSKQDAPDRPHA